MLCFNCQTKTNSEKRYPRMASITQDMRFRLSLIRYAENMVSLTLPSNTRPTGSISTTGNVVLTTLSSPYMTYPDILINTLTSILLRRPSSSQICTEGILTSGLSSSGANSWSGAIPAPFPASTDS